MKRFDPKNFGDQRLRRVLEKDENGRTIYDRYNFNNKRPSQLPIEKRRNEIIDQIEGNTITILTGPTGCGNKTVFISKNNFFPSLMSVILIFHFIQQRKNNTSATVYTRLL